MLHHAPCFGKDTLPPPHTHTDTHTHTKKPIDYSSPTLPQCSHTFMSAHLYLFLTLDVQSAVSGLVAADIVTLMFTGASSICFSSVLFHFSFSCHVIFLFWAAISTKRQPGEMKSSPPSESWTNTEEERSLADSLIRSPRDIYVTSFNECASALADLTDLETGSQILGVYVRFNASESWLAELTLFSCRDSAFSPGKHFSTLCLTSCCDFWPELHCGWGNEMTP